MHEKRLANPLFLGLGRDSSVLTAERPQRDREGKSWKISVGVFGLRFSSGPRPQVWRKSQHAKTLRKTEREPL